MSAPSWKFVPVDDATKPEPQSVLPFAMIEAGENTYDQIREDLGESYVAGETPDWDSGMAAVAIFRAMCAAAPSPWQPISEAADIKRDETPVLLWTSGTGMSPVVAEWHPTRGMWWAEDGTFLSADGPTHFCLIPPPPEEG